MGLFDFLKNIFSEEPEPKEKTENLSLEHLNPWLDEKSKQAFENANINLSEIKKQISQEKLSLGVNIKKLEEGIIKNTEIPDRVKQIMEGNRRTYLSRINSLIEKANVPDKFSELIKFSNTFNNTMADFDKSIAKNHHVMSEFFPKEAAIISENIRKIDKHIKDINGILEKNKITHLENIKNQLVEVQNKIKLKSNIENEISKEKKSQEKQNTEALEKEKELNKSKESEEYSEFMALTTYKHTMEKDLSTHLSSMNHSFSEIEAALKKHTNLNKEDKLSKSYLENPIKTLTEDNELEITKIIDKIKTSISKNEIDLKDKKKEKIQKELEKLTNKNFADFIEKQSKLNEKLTEANSKIEESEIAKRVQSLKNELEEKQMSLLQNKQTLTKLEKEFQEINIDNSKKGLENEIISNLEKQVKII